MSTPYIGVRIVALLAVAVVGASPANADNSRLNKSVISNVYTIQQRAGCTNDVKVSPPLQLAAEWHVNDLMANRSLDGNLGSDGSTPQSRSAAAGFNGSVQQTVAINPALAISGVEIMNKWIYDPVTYGIMSDCNTYMGVWSANSLDRTVVVAVYGKPA